MPYFNKGASISSKYRVFIKFATFFGLTAPHMLNWYKTGALSALPFPFDAQASDIKGNSTLEAGMLARERSETMHIKNKEQDRTLSQHFNWLVFS